MSSRATTEIQKKIFTTWGVMDALYITWYCSNSWLIGNTPYISDLRSTLTMIEQQGSVNFFVAIASWGLQLSIIVSCLLFIFRARPAKYLAYIQAPFRLFFLIPSISLLLIAAKFLPGFNFVFMALIIVSEALKAWSLWRYA